MPVMGGPDIQPSASNSALPTPQHLFVPIESLSSSPTFSTGSASVLEWTSNSDSDQFQLNSPTSNCTLTAPPSPPLSFESPIAQSPPRVSSTDVPMFDQPFVIDWNELSFPEDPVSPAPMPEATDTAPATPTAVDDAPGAGPTEQESEEFATLDLIKRLCLEDTVNKWQANAHDATVANDTDEGQSQTSPSLTATEDTSMTSTIRLAFQDNEVAPSAKPQSYGALSFTVLKSDDDDDTLGGGISIAEYFQRKATDTVSSEEIPSSTSVLDAIATESEPQRPTSPNSALSYFSQPPSPARQRTASLTSQDDDDGSIDNNPQPQEAIQLSSRSSSRSQSILSDGNDYQQASVRDLPGNDFTSLSRTPNFATPSRLFPNISQRISVAIDPPLSATIESAAPPSPWFRQGNPPVQPAWPIGGALCGCGTSGITQRVDSELKGTATPAPRQENLPSIPSWLNPPEMEFRAAVRGEQSNHTSVPFVGSSMFSLHPWLNASTAAVKAAPSSTKATVTFNPTPPAPSAPKQRPPLPPLPLNTKTYSELTPQFALRDEPLKPEEHVGTPFAQAFPSCWNAKSPSLTPSPRPWSPIPDHRSLSQSHQGASSRNTHRQTRSAAYFANRRPGYVNADKIYIPPTSPTTDSLVEVLSPRQPSSAGQVTPIYSPLRQADNQSSTAPFYQSSYDNPISGDDAAYETMIKDMSFFGTTDNTMSNDNISSNNCNGNKNINNMLYSTGYRASTTRCPSGSGGSFASQPPLPFYFSDNGSAQRQMQALAAANQTNQTRIQRASQQMQPRWGVRFAPTPSPPLPPVQPFPFASQAHAPLHHTHPHSQSQVPYSQSQVQSPPLFPSVLASHPQPASMPMPMFYPSGGLTTEFYSSASYSSPAPVIPPPQSLMSDPSAGWYTTSRKYAFADASVIFRVETHLFKVHRHFFERHSDFFRKLLSTYWYTESNHVFLQDVKKVEFERLLSIFYPMDLIKPDITTLKGWLSLLTLSQKWDMAQVKQLCIQHIGQLAWPMEKVIIAHKYNLRHPGPAWLFPAYKEVCARSVPLPLHEAEQLDMETVIKIWEVQHEVGNMRLRGEGAEVTEKRVEEMVKEKFGNFEGEMPYPAPIPMGRMPRLTVWQ